MSGRPSAAAERAAYSILNLTQHVATPDQVSAGVLDPPPAVRAAVSELLTFDALPTAREIGQRAAALALIASMGDQRTDDDTDAVRYNRVMIGGAPWLMRILADALRAEGLEPLFAFSRRESADGPDGRKVSVFRHAGWIEAH